jgi:hypothetical protein
MINTISEERKRKFTKKLKNLIKKRKDEHLKFKNIPPRYDEVYFEGMKWLDSL